MTGQCEITECQKPAKYALYKTFSSGKKVWLHVCKGCEAEIGNENMKRVGGRYSQTFI